MSLPSSVQRDRERIAKGGLLEFVRSAWPLVESLAPAPGDTAAPASGEFVSNWHIEQICRHLEMVTRGEIIRLAVNIPPGCSKSLICSIFWPAWEWGPAGQPGIRSIFSSYSSTLSEYHGRIFRDLVDSGWYQERWSVPLTTAGVIEVVNSRLGWRYATSVGGAITGKHADKIVGDDLLKVADATAGGDIKAKARRHWNNDLATRRRSPQATRRVLIGQRLCDDDPFSELNEEYVWLVYPMRGANDPPSPGDTRKIGPEGELLWPERYPEESVRELEIALGPVAASAQLGQQPLPQGGAIFDRAWLVWWTDRPKKGLVIQCWDFAFKDHTESDYFAGQVWMDCEHHYYLLDQLRDRKRFPDLQASILRLSLRWPDAQDLYFEDRGNGPAVAQQLEALLKPDRWKTIAAAVLGLRPPLPDPPRLRFHPITPVGSKLARAQAVTGLWRDGLVHLPSYPAPWIQGFIKELCSFNGSSAKGRHDDQVDAMAHALTVLGESRGGYAEAWKRRLATAQTAAAVH